MSLFNLLSSFGDGIAKLVLFFANFGSIFVAIFKGLFSSILYLLFCGIAIIVNTVETIFKKLVGIDVLYLNGQPYGGASDGTGYDLVYAFITNTAVQNVFWSIVALSLVLLIIFTIVAMIKSEFTLDLKGSAKGPIIARAGKSLVNLLVVPVVTIISILATNFLSKTIYDLFDQTGNTIVQKCWYIGAYNANRARLSEDFANDLASNQWSWLKDDNAIINGTSPFAGKNSSQIASMVDEYFLDGKLQNVDYNNFGIIDRLTDIVSDKAGSVIWDCVFYAVPSTKEIFSFMDPQTMNLYYDMWQFDYILAIGSAIVIGWMLLGVCLVLLKRVFELTILFLLAPAMTSIAPLDGGQAEKKWRNEFMKRLLAVIGPIFAYNMYFLLIPLFENISLFGGGAYSICMGAGAVSTGGAMLGSMANVFSKYTIIMDIFFQLICIITGMGIIKSASALLSSLLGVDDLVKSGGEAAKKAVDVGKKAALGATAIAGVGFKGAAVLGKGLYKSAKGLGNKAGRLQNKEDKAKAKLEKAQAKAEADPTSYRKQRALEKAEKKRNTALRNNSAYLKKKQDKASEKAGKKYEKRVKKISDKMESIKEQEGKYQGDFTGHEDHKKKLDFLKERYGKLYKDTTGVDYGTDISGADRASRKTYLKKRNESRMGARNLVAEKVKTRAQGSTGFISGFRDAKDEELGAESHNTSIASKVFRSSIYKNTIGRTNALNDSLQGLFNPTDNTAIKRRLNDGLSGLFGDGGGADLWKIWFNKNARAGLFEGVPEAKKRGAKIEANVSWAARGDYEEGKKKKDARGEEERLIRRMLAEKSGNKEMVSMYQKLENGTISAEKVKLQEDLTGLTKMGRDYYDAMKPGSAKAKDLQAYKDRMRDEATIESKQNEEREKERIKALTGGQQETKISEASVESLSKAFAEAMSKSDGFKLKQSDKKNQPTFKMDQGSVNVLSEAIRTGNETVANALNALANEIKGMNGGGNSGGKK